MFRLVNELNVPMKPAHLTATQGFSLVEVLFCMVFVSLIMLPLILVLGQTMQSSRGVYIQSTRGIFVSSASDQMDAYRSDYYQQFNDTTMNTNLSESGQTLPYMNKVDTTNSDTFQRMAYLYSYDSTSSATSSPRYDSLMYNSTTLIRLRCGNTSSFLDTSGQEWVGDAFAYDTTKKQPGYVTGSSGTTGSNTTQSIVNVSTTDAPLYQYYREGTGSTTVDYSFDVPNGNYTVYLHFCEMNATITGSSPNRRLMDIYLEGTLQNSTAYSPYETTGGSYRANIQAYDITVSDNVLNVSIRRNASSNNDARISGIKIMKRLIQ